MKRSTQKILPESITHLGKLSLSEGRTVVKCICECNQSGRRVVFDPWPVARSTTSCLWRVYLQRKRVAMVSAALRHKNHSPGAS